MPKTKEFVTSSSGSESDSGDEPPKKKQKSKEKVKAKEMEKPKSNSQKNAAGDIQFELSRMRFVTVREFKGKALIDIREHYEKDGEMLPGRKGISLSKDQWRKLKEQIDEIDEVVQNM
ncbi:activated RNA polymerase II transcriptional coactivator p15-like [Lineus longissimus]|uniref:activated RNA polymerase II transcriptional coactivator p15-like n=1 Tax=Lineus longissimus TaxID=88925 RepID=UPI002B4EC79E